MSYLHNLCFLLAQQGGATGNFDEEIKLPSIANESTHFIASVLMDIVRVITRFLGLSQDDLVVEVLYVSLVVLIALAIGSGIKWLVVKIVQRLPARDDTSALSLMIRGNFFTKLSRIIPPLVMIILVQFALADSSKLVSWIERFLWIYVTICFTLALSTLVDVIWLNIDARENKKKLPLKGVAQVVRVLLWFICVIVILSALMGKSPMTLLAGLGAFAAVLMLVFKDTILGVVAGVQLSENDMLRVGDWVVVDGTSANGNVTEVTLTSVKVQNWDKTVTTVPPYSLISGSFKNFRPMQQSGTRRIQRTYMIDADTVRQLTPKMLDSYRHIRFMDEYITRKLAQRAAGKEQNIANSEGLADGTIDTNLGLLRAYVKMYLDNNPNISHSDTCFVNTLQQTPNGIPLQIYCFTNTSKWVPYEGIQSEIFEHMAAILPMFDLYVWENASGRDNINNGVIEAKLDPRQLYGLPYPFMASLEGMPGQDPVTNSPGSQDPLTNPVIDPAPEQPVSYPSPASKNDSSADKPADSK